MNNSALFIILYCIIIWNLIDWLRQKSLSQRKAYVKVLCDFNEKLFRLVKAGCDKADETSARLGKIHKTTPDELEDIMLLAALTDLTAIVQLECLKAKLNPFLFISNPVKKCKKRYSKYLRTLNKAHEKFSGYLAA